MNIAYLINQYPKVSHSFIRREILALESRGVKVSRLALRGWNDTLVDELDVSEREKTTYILRLGYFRIITSVITQLFNTPRQLLNCLYLAIRQGIKSDRNWFYHIIYLAEACTVLDRVKSEDIDHIHAHFGTNSTTVAMYVRLLGGPTYSFTVHGPEEFDKPESLCLKDKIEHSLFTVAISSFGRSQLYRWIDQRHWSKINIVHCGLDQAFTQSTNEGHRPCTNNQLLCIGRLCEQKGQLILLQAAANLIRDEIDFRLVFAGDGPMRQVIEEQIKELKLEDRVEITGWISSHQVKEYLSTSRAMVLPSFAEGLPVVIMEAMALSRVVVSTYIAGIPELIRSGQNGYLVPAGDVESLTRSLKEVLQLSEGELDTLGELARSDVLQQHDINTEAAKLHALFKQADTTT